MTRNEIRSMIKSKNDLIKSLNDEISLISRRPKKTREVLVGRIHWIESFKDESTDEIRKIERSRVVYQDGVWYVYN